MFSPRAWGWSDTMVARATTDTVLPTCVGMVRKRSLRFYWAVCSPHVRGDGPIRSNRLTNTRRFSPRAWGWSEVRQGWNPRNRVLPTCVGMVREWTGRPDGWRCSPHVRGDGPIRNSLAHDELPFSPRAWGWSAMSTNRTPHETVLPTCVGMVRIQPPRLWARASSPHVRGDGPRVSM